MQRVYLAWLPPLHHTIDNLTNNNNSNSKQQQQQQQHNSTTQEEGGQRSRTASAWQRAASHAAD